MNIDPTTDRVTSELPKCLGCGTVARPAVLMFGDGYVQSDRIDHQDVNHAKWIQDVIEKQGKLVVVEIGAGVAVPSIRLSSFSTCCDHKVPLIRINPENPEIHPCNFFKVNDDIEFEFIGLPLGALEAITAINDLLVSM
jgi:NAD-dependent SIR2 family protein deacetylase